MHNSPLSPDMDAGDTRLKMIEAIAQKRAISARYNGSVMKLAPHALFERHGELFICALNMGKAWRTEQERRLGQFKLSGLSETAVLKENFDALQTEASSSLRPSDSLLLAV